MMQLRLLLLLLTASAAPAADRLVLANLRALAASGEALVALSAAGSLQRSADHGGIFITTRAAGPYLLNNVSANGPVVIAVGDAGFVVRSVTSGQLWSEASSPAFAGELRDVAGAGAGFWVAVGRKELNLTALWSADDGATWTPGAVPAQTGTLQGVTHDAGTGRWTAVGGDGLLGARIVTSADGKVWTAVAPPAGTHGLADVAADGQGRVLAVGEGGTLISSADAGQAFTAGPQSQTLLSQDLQAVIFAPGAGWIVAGDEQVRLLCPTAGGATVTQAAVPGAAPATALALNAGNEVLVAGNFAVAAPPAPGRLVNLSIRAQAGAGSATLIAGFVTTAGAGGASLLVRAAGPALLEHGVTGVLGNPRLTVNNAVPAVIQTNDDWAPALAANFSHVGAAPWAAGSPDAAVALEVSPGLYTALLTGADGGSGVALGEIYDMNGEFLGTKARLINVSARAQVGTGASLLIAGFVIAGQTPLRVLIRGVGPALAGQGVTGVLADPQLAVFRGPDQIGANGDWDPALAATFALVGAAPLPAASKDAAAVLDLSPGVYTAQVSGAGATTGVALVEIYAVPDQP